ncbi:MAG TPA: DUF2911 domain-containing protein [Longimicrobiaceae bacterium]|nr:DUF2911 domain-containing protein [Longimicrobiaceae bacterium]
MYRLRSSFAVGGLVALACLAGPRPAAAQATSAIGCTPTAKVEGRASPYDSTDVTVGGRVARVCYSRPSMRGRTIFGGLVPYDTLWRTGANEPTIVHLPVAATIAGIAVPAGSYSLYTVPGRDEWTVIVNRSTSQWGIESQYTPAVRAQEVGRARVKSEPIAAPVDTFTIRSLPAAGGAADLVLEWEKTRVRIPVKPAG